MGKIELIGMEFHAYHGCLDIEKQTGNLFVVDFCGETQMDKAELSDELTDATDYSKIYETIAEEMKIPSNLLENVAGRICNRIKERFPEFVKVEVSVAKRRPPVNGVCQWSKITISK